MLEPKDVDRYLIRSNSETEMQSVLGKIQINNAVRKESSKNRRGTFVLNKNLLRVNTIMPSSIPTDPNHKRQSERIFTRNGSESESIRLSDKNELSRKEYHSMLSKQAYDLESANLKTVTTNHALKHNLLGCKEESMRN